MLRPSLPTVLLLAFLLGSSPAAAVDEVLAPTDNLRVEEIPPIPLELVERVRPYTEIRSASFTDWHPKDGSLLISTRFGETSQIHRVERPGGARTQLTFFREPVRFASYDPVEAGFFVLLRDTGGDEFYQLYRFDLATGETHLLTDGKRRHSPGPWSNDGRRMVYTVVDADADGAFTEIWTVDPRRPESGRRVTTVRGGGWGISDWSPGDERLLVVEYLSINESHVWELEVATGEKRRVTPEPAAPGQPAKVAWGGGLYSPRGNAIYLATDLRGEFRQLARLALRPDADGGLEVLSEDIPWDVSSYDLSPDGATLAFTTNEAGITRLYLLATASGERRAVEALPTGVGGGVDWDAAGRRLGITLSTASSSGDAYVVDAESLAVEPWTRSETGGIPAERFVEPELVEWTTFDERTISGFLYRPDPERFPGPRPVVVNIHGGPEGQSRPSFKGSWNLYPAELGVAVLYPNVRGSSGFGKSFLQLDNGFLREGSYEDIRTLFDWIEEDAALDGDQILVTGGSYGGHMAFAVATRYSDRICCSVPVVGISSLRTFLENTQGYRRDLRRAEYGDERDPEMYAFLEKIAPLNHAEKIQKPIFIVHGANDPRVPLSESEQIVGAVRDNGVPAWYLVADDEGHGFQKKGNRDFQTYAMVLFVERFLLDR